ncbi:HAD family hydrolase [Cellulomonas dongxiuzhuiae]|uniref:Cof-type HAD-IIB family hydrolase n=1 Tax=Cellulomonas dongxiuzhuiae TaxID=2819979 RepID=A0ABX8GHT5_9CELL|nr:HAD family hydrolase [Cellulomonas dongxiuzhuiae]MBO3087890.1 HAD family phosphatase [Cellulomonas dongxiuzhuiae]MBO3094761.1 HAD family phosphatase [Cellulomonas dongxiuzhuiae]QWC15758.1 Cof-type HAD-IIB family hydrolase [Cellulomonas dongxiuzhuiae]
MSRTRLVALDVDGTLMSYDGVISDDVRTTVTALVDAGVHVVLATGRSAHSAVAVAQDLGLTHGWVVCSNGAVTARLDADEENGWTIAGSVTFDPGPALRAIALELPDALYAVEDLGVGFRVSAPFPPGEMTGEVTVVAFDELASAPATRVVIRAPQSTPEEFHAIVERVGLHEVTYAVGWSAWLDLTPGGVSKASALEEVRRALGVEPYETLAIGDGENDLEMLRWAARGVAMGHANDAVRGAADEVTGTIEDDGAVAVLRHVLV